MIISTVIQIICILLISWELFNIYRFFRGCKKVRCTVVSSKKIVRRRHDYLTDEFFRTKVSFDNNGVPGTAILRTSTFCPIGQRINCYYHREKHIIFRKRDLRKNLRSSSLIITSVSILFVVLNSLFSITAVSKAIFNNIVNILVWGLSVIFALIGAFLIVYAVYAFRSYRSKDVKTIKARIEDVIMKTTRDNNNVRHTYYPIYSYTFNGVKHTVISKMKYSSPPKKGTFADVRLNTAKGNLVEFNDVGKSFFEGLSLFLITGCFIAVKWFLILPIR